MSEVKIMPPEEVRRMFDRLGELTLNVTEIKRKFIDCPYGEDPRQKLDIYLPNEGGGPFPIIFFAHGGGWTGGVKSDVQIVPFISGVKRGYAVIALGYRLIPGIRYPENLFDIKAALRWVAANAETYLLDPTRTALCGASAGAHLAMMAAFTQGQAVFEGASGVTADSHFTPSAIDIAAAASADCITDGAGRSRTHKISSASAAADAANAFTAATGSAPATGAADIPTCVVRAVVDQFGPTDFSKFHMHYDESGYARAQPPGTPGSIDTLLGTDSEQIPNMIRFANPIDNVHSNVPPILIQHGRYDPIIPYQQSTELYDKVNTIAGAGMAEIDLSEEFLHADPGYAAAESVERIFSFLDKYLI